MQCHPALAAVETCYPSKTTQSSLGPYGAPGLVGSIHAKYRGLGNSLTALGGSVCQEIHQKPLQTLALVKAAYRAIPPKERYKFLGVP